MKFNRNGKRICGGKKCNKSIKAINREGMYCKFHALYPYAIHPSLLRKSDRMLLQLESHQVIIENNNYCHRITCNETDNLIEVYNGLFREIHYFEIKNIRDQITHDESRKDILLHMDEYVIRKIPCRSHINYILRNLGKVYDAR